MATMDGSFNLGAAVERFFHRCPELRGVRKLDDLEKKGNLVTVEEVVSVMAELFPNPSYTIALMGCFRPIGRMIVDEAVVLLRHCHLSSDNYDNSVVEPGRLVDVGVVYVIDHYGRMGRGLYVHELACLAFCRALHLNNSLWGSVLAYFKFAPPPFQRLLVDRRDFELKVATHCLLPVRITYRLLVLGSEFLSERWDWSCFLDLVNKLACIDVNHGTVYEKEMITDTRWCGIQILCIVLKMNDRAVANSGLGTEEAALSQLRWEEFCQDVAVEKICSFIDPSEIVEFHSIEWSVDLDHRNFLKPCHSRSITLSEYQEVDPISKSRKLGVWDGTLAGNRYVLTTTANKIVDLVLLSLNQRWPVLLYGPVGAGKTALISKLAQDAGNQVLSLHMDDQIDGKTLIGSYVCSENPGEFRWQPGSLIQAVVSGYWVVLEDIDKASPDVQSILLPLLEGAHSFVTDHGEEIEVNENFRLFSTIATSKNDASSIIEAGNLLSNLWRRVMIDLSNSDDLHSIVKAWYPNFEGPLVGKLIETLAKVNNASANNFIRSQSGNYSSSSSHNRFSLRDILKWCKRIAGLGCLSGGDLLMYQRRSICKEAVDIFATSSMSSRNRLILMKQISNLWDVEAENPCSYKPEVQVLPTELRIGRVTLQRMETALCGQDRLVKMRGSLQVLERIACSVKYNEPVLLVGETGTGKTTLVQNLAMILGQKLTVLNLSQQSDVADLLGGFKPMDPHSICVPLYKEFEDLFSNTFSMKENDKLFAYLQKQLTNKNWKSLLVGFKKYVDIYLQKVQAERTGSGKKRKKPLHKEEKLKAWKNFSSKVDLAHGQIVASSGMVFSFVEGAFVSALRNGEWILLDEVNLAPPETLQRLVGVLEGEYGSICLAERGDISCIPRHPSFRIFACMNPANDVGKRDLPYSLRSRFTEYFVNDILDKEDLKLFINSYMEESLTNSEMEKRVIDFYESVKKCSEEGLQDGANQKPQYSLRSLYRALEYTRMTKQRFGFEKAVYDGFRMFFSTLLDQQSAKIVDKMIIDKLLRGTNPSPLPFELYLRFKKDSSSDEFLENYVLTDSVKQQLENLAHAVFIKRYPVLLQGPTSSGKTSLVQYLAAKTGHEFVRINNHEHTDLQEYLGSYLSDASGKLVFQEGVLVKAVRNGYWIVLDELNLAPSDVLEALNRLLDDNRELFVPELRETIQAHPDFMLFATQNPPTFYGGRKMLSRAFRNRFIELHVEEIPDKELGIIIEKRCKIPRSRAETMVKVMKDLQLHRQSSKVFAGKHGFITPRDLFRWANRLTKFGCSKEVMAEHGYYLLADRLRDEGERCVVQEVLERHLGVRIVNSELYKEGGEMDIQNYGDVILTKSMRRLYFLIKCSYELREPVLLVGETGGGKTTACQLLSRDVGSKLHILNCHQYTETADFIGGFYPIRERSRLSSEFRYIVEKLRLSKAYIHFPKELEVSLDINEAPLTLGFLDSMIRGYQQGQVSIPDVMMQDIVYLEGIKSQLSELHQNWQTIFMWQDGPLVEAMKSGNLFLADEISLADDSVLERLNSVLEPEKKLSLAEKGGSIMEQITAHKNFFVLATMNPGGDYGKKELSAALRNRFTEIWVPSVADVDELRDIALIRFSNTELSYIVEAMLTFWEWFNQLQSGRVMTVRDLLSWIGFINVAKGSLGPDHAVLHGLFLVLLDGLSLGTGMPSKDAVLLREKCLNFLVKGLKLKGVKAEELSVMGSFGWGDLGKTADTLCSEAVQSNDAFGIHPFFIEKGDEKCDAGGFEFLAPTTRRNALRVLRAMQLPKPVLLEGSPGVGKTSLILALGKYSGHKVVRINLSEQTDLMDLLGSDLPVESGEGMKFAWSDGILLQALKEGCWVLLDELNLAPQSVLEGLNSILDHRAEVFIPELGLTFKCPSSFRVFACQNPISQGGGRKGLPRSFLNRFTKVYIDELVEDDYMFICTSLYPSVPRNVLSNLISFNKQLYEDTMVYHKFAQNGLPWEFNLRDVIRSCQIIQGSPKGLEACDFLNVVYIQRMRSVVDRRELLRLYEEVFGVKPFINPYPRVHASPQFLVVGNAAIKRKHIQSSRLSNQLNIMPSIRHSLEAVSHCVQHKWLCILVGPASSGKTSLIRLLAQLTGNVLNVLNLSSATDISELLGSFEQYNAFRNFRSVVAQVKHYVDEYCSSMLESSNAAFLSERKDTISKWLAFLCNLNSGSMSSSFSATVEHWDTIVGSLGLLVKITEQLELDLTNYSIPVTWSSKDLKTTMKAISKLLEDQRGKPFSAKFEWVAGTLIKAIENGEWIILENANLCTPTVLDRINSLVEQSGSITVNECGNIDGSPVVLHPHPNFRMFLTVNPKYGEVSRAMRNRGVEIFVMEPYWLYDEVGANDRGKFEIRDVQRFIVLSGVPVTKLVDSMAKAHLYARNESLHFNVEITYLELARWVQLFLQLLVKGNRPVWSLQQSWEHSYLSSLGEALGRDIIIHAKLTYLSPAAESDLPVEYSLFHPGGWPLPLKLTDYIWYPKETSVKQNFVFFEYLAADYAFRVAFNSEQSYRLLAGQGYLQDYLLQMMHRPEFLRALNKRNSNSGRITESELKVAKKKLWFALNWTIEQATKSDYELYLLRFRWLLSQLPTIDKFLSSLLNIPEQEIEHPVWKIILKYHPNFTHLGDRDLSAQQGMLLSGDLVALAASSGMPEELVRLLSNAINCVNLLRLSYQQWNAQSGHVFVEKDSCYKLIFQSLEELEKQVLNLLVESQSFDLLVELYTKLLGDHIVFWDAFTLSQHENLMIPWHFVMKDLLKLQYFCPESVQKVLEGGNKILEKCCFHNCEQSLLWIHGGRPFMPSSDIFFDKQKQFEKLWPAKANTFGPVNNCLEEVIASFNPELRTLALQGICLSFFITNAIDQDENEVICQLDEMYKMLLERLGYEKQRLEKSLQLKEDAISWNHSCCVFDSEFLCTESGFVSWQETASLSDSTSFVLDMELLQKLSLAILVDARTLDEVGGLSSLLESALRYSLAFSTRPPQNFVPHQKILWTLDAWTSVDSANAKLSSYVHEIWFWWHSSLWSQCTDSIKDLLRIGDHDILLPNMLLQPVGTAFVIHILEGSCAIKDHFLQCLKLRVASANLWKRFTFETDVDSFLASVSCVLFQQIIYAHKKAFDDDKFGAIKAILYSLQKNMATQDDVRCLGSLISSSRHQKLNSCLNQFIEPLLRDLYLPSSSPDYYLAMGRAWLRIGGLRFSLLSSFDDLDPALKRHWKYTVLEEKISSLELEIKVREECNYLAGWSSLKETDSRRAESLEKLKIECKRLKRKMVLPRDPEIFNAVKQECQVFDKRVAEALHLADNIEYMEFQQVLGQVCNWQVTAKCFIDQLSDSGEYKKHNDMIQPVQVAVYEMKLGLSLLLNGLMQKSFLSRINVDNVNKVLDTIYSFMKFPRDYASRLLSSGEIDIPDNFWELEMNLLENMVWISGDAIAEKEASLSQLKSSLHQNFLFRVAHFVSDAQRIDKASFKTLDTIFYGVADTWLRMKDEVAARKGLDAQQYKFKPRAFKIKSVLDDDVAALGTLLENDTCSEWEASFSQEEDPEKMDTTEDYESLENEWEHVHESISDNMVGIHNRLFGSTNLIQSPGAFHISDRERLTSFTDSYTIGARMIKGLAGPSFPSLDAKLVAEHQLRLCLEHEQNYVSSRELSAKYNFYKDSNAPAVAKMVKLLISLQRKIVSLLSEWEEHPGVQKIKDTIEMLLNIPMDTPVAKALSGLQFLMNRVKTLQEDGSKFSLSDRLEPLVALVCSWKKMEFDSWPALLDEVQDQYETNAAKLWFPLYSVLHSSKVRHEQSIIESLEGFIHTSSIGEFRKRLQLLFAFHGQISAGRCLEVECYSSDWQERLLDMLYNVFGYHVQFLPRIVEHVQAHRKNIEMELKELLKLCRWERPETCLSIENSRRTRQKLRKLIQKYTDLLQQPLSLVLNQATFQGIDKGSPQGLVPPNNISEDSFGVLDKILDQMQLDNNDRSMSLSGWKKLVDTLQNLQFDKTFKLSLLDSEGTWRQFSASQSTYPLNLECRSKLWQTIEKICKTTLDCNEIWEDVTKGAGKKRALSELLKLLESSGLQKHKFETAEVSNNTSSFFRQPSYDAHHLLLTQSRLVCGAPDISMTDEFQGLPDHSLDREWKTANEFYFKSAASVRVLLQTCLVPHEDITHDQAMRSVSFLNHLLIIQQEQRFVAYGFVKDLKCLYESVCALENMYTKCTGATGSSESCIAPNQNIVFKCMWKQKELFDGLVAMLNEESLLLKKVESTHFKSCQSVRTAASNALHVVEKFIPIIQKAREKSKESLRNHLLACSGAIWSHSKQLWNDTHLGISATSAVSCNQFVVSKKMELTLYENFEVLENFEKHVLEFCQNDSDKSPVIESLLANFDGLLKKGKKLLAERLKSLCNGAIMSTNHFEELKCCTESGSHLATEAEFDGAIKRTFDLIMNVLKNNWSPNNGQTILQDSSMNITMWESLYKTSVQNLNLKEICDNILKTIFHAESLLNHSTSRTPSLSLHVGMCFEHLHALLDAVLSFSGGILKDFLATHKTGAIMTHVLANVLASLFSKGFRIPSKDKEEDASHDVFQDASGTGMGEGSGRQDVSDQITDEDQLLGSSQKPGEEPDDLKEVPKEKNKGIEMEEDFMADACSVSENSEEESGDGDGDGDEQLDNAMGEAGPSSEVVDEKLWNKEEDEKPSDSTEKYESGPSVRDRDGSNQELRAKEDSTAIDNNENEELNYGEPPHENGEIGDQKDVSDIEENEGDTKMDKEKASTDPSGIMLDEVNQSPDEDMDVDEEMNGGEEEIGQGQENEFAEDEKFEEENATPTDGTKDEAVMKQIDEASGEKDPGGESEEKLEMNSMMSMKDIVGPGIADLMDDHVPSGHSGTQPTGNFKESSSTNGAPEAVMSDAIEATPNFAPLRSLPQGDTSGVDVMVSDPLNMGSLADKPQQAENAQKPSSSLQNPQPNPYRSVGDALEEWKERVKVSMDLREENQETHDETDDENAKEYGYVSKNEKGTAQAMGSATSEQIESNVPSYERDDGKIAAQKDDDAKMETEKPEFEELHFKNKALLFSHKKEQTQILHYDDVPEVELVQIRGNDKGDSGKSSENFVSVRKSFSDDLPLGDLSIDDELGKAQDLELVSVDSNSDGASLWRKYQMRTTRLSQELAEQLRLVMEPTLASKLQGDYKTGKRINMKKVIPYIASHYRKDKIWLRRTRPNKRDYQVVIAVDDSRSMSESYCGDVAVESLVTVCNAMSQLEMGSMAVASFGKKGNIRLLHDFDQPFTVESGMKVISSLSFKQENTIADEPVVDLLKYLNDMLDVAVANARLPSGHNPLQQLVLIIGDGQFHERAKLKRCVRDFSSQKRMVAFLILDNGQESIVNREEATIGAGNVVKFTKYLDSFPFPYYIVLKNIEALPRTLGDLLRQWFEIMQTSRD